MEVFLSLESQYLKREDMNQPRASIPDVYTHIIELLKIGEAYVF